jgi:hypothetical protein
VGGQRQFLTIIEITLVSKIKPKVRAAANESVVDDSSEEEEDGGGFNGEGEGEGGDTME